MDVVFFYLYKQDKAKNIEREGADHGREQHGILV